MKYQEYKTDNTGFDVDVVIGILCGIGLLALMLLLYLEVL